MTLYYQMIIKLSKYYRTLKTTPNFTFHDIGALCEDFGGFFLLFAKVLPKIG